MVLKCPQRNYTSCKLSIWPINKVLLLLLVEFNTHWLCVEKSWFFSVWYSLLKDIQTTVLLSFCEFNASSQFKQRKDLCDLSGEFKYKSDISNRCFILQFQRPETRVNLANAHAIDINDKKERYMLLHLLVLSQIWNQKMKAKSFVQFVAHQCWV